jgi:hypothetical protein
MKNRLQQAFFSANLHRYRPDIPWETHELLYEKFVHYHKPLPLAKEPQAPRIQGHSITKLGIITLFHLGDHALLPTLLLQAGIPFDLVLSEQVYQKYRQLFAPLSKQRNCLLAEDPTLLLKLRRSLQQDRHILIYADGHAGVQPHPKALIAVPFFEHQLSVRKGIAYMQHLFQVPIYPLINQGTHAQPSLFAHPPIWPSHNGKPKEQELLQTMTKLYATLQARLHAPESCIHWSGWGDMHLQGMLHLPSTSSTHVLDLQNPWTVPLTVAGETIWFDKARYIFYRI